MAIVLDFEKPIIDIQNKIDELMQNKGIIRNKLKINASINNSKIFKFIVEEYGSFYNYFFRRKVFRLKDGSFGR